MRNKLSLSARIRLIVAKLILKIKLIVVDKFQYPSNGRNTFMLLTPNKDFLFEYRK